MTNEYIFSESNNNGNNNNPDNNVQQGSFIEASFSNEDYSALISAENVQLENPSIPHYVEDDVNVNRNNENNQNNNLGEVSGAEVDVEIINQEEFPEEVSPIVDYEARIRKQLIGVHIFCIVMAFLSIGVMFLEIFPAIVVCVIYLREDMNNRTAKHDRLLLTLTITNFTVSLVSLLINVFIIFALCTFTFFLASILFVFILPYTFVFRFVSRELLLNRGYTTNNIYYHNSVNNANAYPSPYISPHHHHHPNIQLHQIHHHHVPMATFHPYPHHSAHHVAHHHNHHHSPHHGGSPMHPF